MKRALLAGLIVGVFVYALLMFMTSASASPSPCYACDLNRDGRVNSIDTVLAKGQEKQHIRSHFGEVLYQPVTATRTRTNTPIPPTPTFTPPPPTPTATPTSILPPPLPTPPAGHPHAAWITITPRDFPSPFAAELFAALDCQIARSVSYYLARETGYTIWFDCYAITATRDGIDLGSEPALGRSGAQLDGLAGAHVHGTGCDATGTIPCDYGYKPLPVQDPDGDGPLKGGQGLNRNAVLLETEEQLGSVLLHNRDGSPRGIRIHSVRNGGGYAGGGTYCLTPLGAQIACADPLARGNFGHAHIGDWMTNYYMGANDGSPFGIIPLLAGVVAAMDPGCWFYYHDVSGRAGTCDDDPRAVSFHEAGHGLCIDTHAPVYLGDPTIHMADVQKAKFIACMAEWVYPVPQEFRDALQ